MIQRFHRNRAVQIRTDTDDKLAELDSRFPAGAGHDLRTAGKSISVEDQDMSHTSSEFRALFERMARAQK